VGLKNSGVRQAGTKMSITREDEKENTPFAVSVIS
jgi:hypothetical protein